MIFSLGESQHERIEVDVLRYERSPVGDYHDDNWLMAKVRIAAGAFAAPSTPPFLEKNWLAFWIASEPLHQSLRGTSQFTTLEEQLRMVLSGDGKGRIDLVGEVADQPGIGNRLHFALHFDQSQLAASIRDLESVISQFPVRTNHRKLPE